MSTEVDRENTWLSINEAAEYLGVHTRTIRRYMRLGRLKPSRVSNKVVRIRLADLDRMMEANVPDKTPEPTEAPTDAVQPAARPAVRPARPASFSPGHF